MIRASKYTISGTTVVVVGLEDILDSEMRLGTLANSIANPNFGAGCDFVAFLSRSPIEKVSVDKYHQAMIQVEAFLADGRRLEASASALCAVAAFMYDENGQSEAWLMNSVSAQQVRQVYIYRDERDQHFHVALGRADYLPDRFKTAIYDDVAVALPNAKVELLQPSVTLASGTYSLNCYATYIGEPYLITFLNPSGTRTGSFTRNLSESSPSGCPALDDLFEQPLETQNDLLSRIIAQFHGQGYSDPTRLHEPFGASYGMFAGGEGINLAFVRVTDTQILEGRFFRRGGHEIRLCGTGAAASTLVAAALGYLSAPLNGVHVYSWLNSVEEHNRSAYVRLINDDCWLDLPVNRIWTGILNVAW